MLSRSLISQTLTSNIVANVGAKPFTTTAILQAKTKSSRKYAQYFRVLELDPDSSQDLVRRQYIRLVKKFHPDSAPGQEEKFHLIDEV